MAQTNFVFLVSNQFLLLFFFFRVHRQITVCGIFFFCFLWDIEKLSPFYVAYPFVQYIPFPRPYIQKRATVRTLSFTGSVFVFFFLIQICSNKPVPCFLFSVAMPRFVPIKHQFGRAPIRRNIY